MKIYRGRRISGLGPVVTVDGRPFFTPRALKHRNCGPVGFEWGYTGHGPAYLALALLFHVTGSLAEAEEQHLHFERQFVARWDREWEVGEEQIRDWLTICGTRTS